MPFTLMVYYPDWTTNRYADPEYDFDYEDLDYSFVTHVGHYAVWPDKDNPGEVKEPTAGGEVTWPETDLIDYVQGQGAKIVLVVGGAGSDRDEGFRKICGHPGSHALREEFVGNVLDIVDDRGYDGVDIDWEWPAYSGIERPVTNATNTTPIRVTAANHGFVSGKKVFVRNVEGNTAANGEWAITIDGTNPTNTFTLNGSSGNGDFVAGAGLADVSPGPEERDGLKDLLELFYDALDSRSLSIVPPASDDNGKWFPIDDDTLGWLDWVAVQTYGMHGPAWSGHAGHVGAIHSDPRDDRFHYPHRPPNLGNLSFHSAIDYWRWVRGVPRSKLLLGIGFFFSWFENAGLLYGANNPPFDEDKNGEWDYNRLSEKAGSGWTQHFDGVAGAAYMTKDVGLGVISRPTEDTVQRSLRFIQGRRLGGIIIWSAGKDAVGGEQVLMEELSTMTSTDQRIWLPAEQFTKVNGANLRLMPTPVGNTRLRRDRAVAWVFPKGGGAIATAFVVPADWDQGAINVTLHWSRPQGGGTVGKVKWASSWARLNAGDQVDRTPDGVLQPDATAVPDAEELVRTSLGEFTPADYRTIRLALQRTPAGFTREVWLLGVELTYVAG